MINWYSPLYFKILCQSKFLWITRKNFEQKNKEYGISKFRKAVILTTSSVRHSLFGVRHSIGIFVDFLWQKAAVLTE